MNKIQQIIITAAMFVFSAEAVLAGMPDELKGSWIIDADASENFMKTSPKWKEEDAKHLPAIFKRMSQVTYLFDDGTITATIRDRQQPLDVQLKESSDGKYIFESKIGDETVTLTVTLNDEGKMNIRSSATDDMAYYLWQRGSVVEKQGPSDASLAADLINESVEKQ